jgi:hypothetical protein
MPVVASRNIIHSVRSSVVSRLAVAVAEVPISKHPLEATVEAAAEAVKAEAAATAASAASEARPQ